LKRSILKKLEGKKIFITGGSSGIGKALADLCIQNGAHVAIAARNDQNLNEAKVYLEGKVSDAEQKIFAFQLDIRDSKKIFACSKEVLEALDGLDILINNAGISAPGLTSEVDEGKIRDVMETNFFGSLNMTRSFLHHFNQQKSGHISFVSSMLGFMGIYGHSVYSSSKFALSGLVECLRQELKPINVEVSIAFLPNTDTPMLEHERASEPEITKNIGDTGRTYQPGEVADIYLQEILKNKFHIVPGFETKLIYLAQRFFPSFLRFLSDRFLK
tara:strand:+ start:40 stop:858 length:819 start_codon:yes stop_codon:yes gene_type:complete